MQYKTFYNVIDKAERGKHEIQYWGTISGHRAVIEVKVAKTGKRKMISVSDIPQWFIEEQAAQEKFDDQIEAFGPIC